MFYKTIGVVCDVDGCDEETWRSGQEARIATVRDRARAAGWSISEAGHFCPAHRKRRHFTRERKPK